MSKKLSKKKTSKPAPVVQPEGEATQAPAPEVDDKADEPAEVVQDATASSVSEAVDQAGRRPTAALPQFKPRRRLEAFKIIGAESLANGRVKLNGIDPEHVVIVDFEFIDAYHPRIGQYYVRNEVNKTFTMDPVDFEAAYETA